MVDDDHVHAVLDRLLPNRLERLQRSTGLPVVFAGTTRNGHGGRRMVLTAFRGTLSDSLSGLSVEAGRGLGGTVMARGTPCRVNDYVSTHAITHDYDHAVVLDEKLTSVAAHPVTVDGVVRAVIYGAVRSPLPIGDVALRSSGVVADQLGRDLGAALRPDAPTGEPDRPRPATRPVDRTPVDRTTAALRRLERLSTSVVDLDLRAELLHIHRELSGPPPSAAGRLAPRELEVLELVALGRSNREIAPQLGLSAETVKAYLRTLMRKLDVSNRTAAVHAARSLGIL